MKAKIIFSVVLFLIMLSIPIGILGSSMGSSPLHKPEASSGESSESSSLSQPESAGSEEPAGETSEGSFRVLDESSGEIQTIPYVDFITGVVAAEMPAEFETEALKAQAVASMTFFLKKQQAQQSQLDPSLSGADFSLDFSQGFGYLTKEQMQEKWGEQYDNNLAKLHDACQQVQNLVLTEDGALITAAYHAISGGVTEASQEVFAESRNYLVPVPSPGDYLAPGYQTTVSFTPEEFKAKAAAAWPEIQLEGDPQTWLGESETTSSGTVTSIQIGSVTPNGEEVRNAFSLRSANFDLIFSQESFLFTVRGYGHGVGLSQYGANYMASQGSGYEEILAWYYPGTKIEQLEN